MSLRMQPAQPMRDEAGAVIRSCSERHLPVWDALACPEHLAHSPVLEGDFAEILDIDIVESLRELLGATVLQQTYSDLLKQTRTKLELIAGESDPVVLRETAHGIRGAAAMLGALSLAAAAARIEDPAATVSGAAVLQPPDFTQKLLEGVARACLATEAALRQERLAL